MVLALNTLICTFAGVNLCHNTWCSTCRHAAYKTIYTLAHTNLWVGSPRELRCIPLAGKLYKVMTTFMAMMADAMLRRDTHGLGAEWELYRQASPRPTPRGPFLTLSPFFF